MKTRIQKLLVGVALVGAATLVQAQFSYTDNGNGTCTITGYTGPGGAVTIPNSIAGLSVVSIGNSAFYTNTSLSSVTIPDSVTNIGDYAFSGCYGLTTFAIPDSVTSIGAEAFWDCASLTSVIIPASVAKIGDGAFAVCGSLAAITVDAANSFYSSASGVLFDKNQTRLIQFPGGRGGSYTIPASVTRIDGAFSDCWNLTSVAIGSGLTRIGYGAFSDCGNLTSVIIPASVARIDDYAFWDCYSLTAAYFLGNCPYGSVYAFLADYGLGAYDLEPVIIYYLAGTTGWYSSFCLAPTELWNPQASALRVTGGSYGFNIRGPAGAVVVVEACTNLAQPVWLPVSSITLDSGGASSFSDSQSANYPARFYRFRSP